MIAYSKFASFDKAANTSSKTPALAHRRMRLITEHYSGVGAVGEDRRQDHAILHSSEYAEGIDHSAGTTDSQIFVSLKSMLVYQRASSS